MNASYPWESVRWMSPLPAPVPRRHVLSDVHASWLCGDGDLIPAVEGGQGREGDEILDDILALWAITSWVAGILLARAGWEAWLGAGTAISGLGLGIASLFWWPV